MAKQEEAERCVNRPEFGKKEKVFPLAEGELARERKAAPMSRQERAFIKDEEEEMPETKQRKMDVPPSEKERVKRKRKEENKKRRMKKEEEKLLAKLAEKPKCQENQIIHLHLVDKILLHPEVVGDAGLKKSGTNSMLRRASIGGRRLGATGPKEEPQDLEEEEKEDEEPSKRSKIAFGDRRLEPRLEAWSNGTIVITL